MAQSRIRPAPSVLPTYIQDSKLAREMRHGFEQYIVRGISYLVPKLQAYPIDKVFSWVAFVGGQKEVKAGSFHFHFS